MPTVSWTSAGIIEAMKPTGLAILIRDTSDWGLDLPGWEKETFFFDDISWGDLHPIAWLLWDVSIAGRPLSDICGTGGISRLCGLRTGARPFLESDADRLIGIVDRASARNIDVTVACTYGRSRSRAVAEWIAGYCPGYRLTPGNLSGIPNDRITDMLGRRHHR